MTAQFITIPGWGQLDPDHQQQVRRLIETADAKFRLSAKAWEAGQNSGNSAVMESQNKRSERFGEEGASLLAPLGIRCSWPGLYPCFEVNGCHEYTTEAAVLAALGKPRNWLR